MVREKIRPSRRGVDRNLRDTLDQLRRLSVAPRAGAWIETDMTAGRTCRLWRSPLTQGRGSKLTGDHAG